MHRIIYPLCIGLVLPLSTSCSSGTTLSKPEHSNSSASNISSAPQPDATNSQIWQLNTDRNSTTLLLPVYQATIGVKPQLTLRISALKTSDNSDTKKTATLAPEHYLRITSTCNEDNSYLKTHTITTYPLGDEGVFTLQLPVLEAGCINTKGVTHIKTILELVLPDPSKSLELRGSIQLDFKVAPTP